MGLTLSIKEKEVAMAKELQNQYEFKVIFDTLNGTLPVETEIHYGVGCEYGDLRRKGMPIELSPQKVHELEELLIEETIPQVNLNEGIEGGE